MSWNNGYETKRHNEEVKATLSKWRKQGMSEEQLEIMKEYMHREFLNRRNNEEYGECVSLYTTDELGNEIIINEESLVVVEESCLDSFTFGFEDSRLQKLWDEGDWKTKQILVFLSQGYKQCEIAILLGVSEKAVSKRIHKYQKNF
jgi:transposase